MFILVFTIYKFTMAAISDLTSKLANLMVRGAPLSKEQPPIDQRANMPPAVIYDLKMMICRLDGAGSQEELLSMKRGFIESLGLYSPNKYQEVAAIWLQFRKEYLEMENSIGSFRPEDFLERVAPEWSHHRPDI